MDLFVGVTVYVCVIEWWYHGTELLYRRRVAVSVSRLGLVGWFQCPVVLRIQLDALFPTSVPFVVELGSGFPQGPGPPRFP